MLQKCVDEQNWNLNVRPRGGSPILRGLAAPKLQANLPTGGADNVRRKETVSTQPGAHFAPIR